MEYVFGEKGEIEVLKTKGDSHSELTGFNQVVQEYPDQTVTDNFRIVRKLDSQEDVEGNCYDWYEIDRHYRTMDKSPGTIAEIEQLRTEKAALEEELTNTQLALCDVYEMIGG